MNRILLGFLKRIIGLLLVLLTLHTLIRLVRHFYKFPMPQFMANLIDNPLRRRIQPPGETALRHGIQPGMTVLEVGPGNGKYTIAAAKRVGDQGKIVTIDIEPKMITRVEEAARRVGVTNIEARIADVYELPYPNGTFDLIYMNSVIGEIPHPDQAMEEFHRVLCSRGKIAFSELLLDPDYPLSQTLVDLAHAAGFRLSRKIGNFFHYTLIFEKSIAGEKENEDEKSNCL